MSNHAYGLAVLAGLLLAATGAAAQQTVEVDARDPQILAPDELPGPYTVEFEVVTDPQGPTCACTETTVELGSEVSPAFTVWNVKPFSYTIDWTDEAQNTEARDVDEPHVKQASITVGADESLYHADQRELTITIEAWHRGPSPHATTETDPLTVTLSPPGAGEEPVREQDGSEDDLAPVAEEEAGAAAGWFAAGGLVPVVLALGVPLAVLRPRQ